MKLLPGSDAALRLERYLAELRVAAERINLVGSTDRAALARHVADSLDAAGWIAAGSRVIDLGSGAGFPGVPIAIARHDIEMTLLEIRERRAHFLRHVVRTLGLRCRVLRVDIKSEPPPELFDVALARAVAPPGRVIALATPWVVTGGEAWIWTSGPIPTSGDPISPIPLGSGGCVLRVRVAAVPRGTPQTP